MIGETGLYGQSERGDFFSQIAEANRFEDIESEGDKTQDGMPTEKAYRVRMMNCIIAEVTAARKEQELEDWYNDLPSHGRDNIVAEVMWRAIEMTVEQERQALDRMGAIAEEMHQHGYHINIIYRTISSATPLAIQRMREIRIKRHANAPTPQSKACKGVMGTTMDTAAIAAKYAAAPKSKYKKKRA